MDVCIHAVFQHKCLPVMSVFPYWWCLWRVFFDKSPLLMEQERLVFLWDQFVFVLCCTCNYSSPSQELGQRFVDCLEQIQLAQNMVVNHELANWRQSQRMFNWEDDRGKVELNTIQQWWGPEPRGGRGSKHQIYLAFISPFPPPFSSPSLPSFYSPSPSSCLPSPPPSPPIHSYRPSFPFCGRFEALAELVWRNRLLAKQVSTQPNYKRMDRQEFDLIS